MMGIGMPGNQILQSQPVDSIIMLGLDSVPFGLPILRQQQERSRVGSLSQNRRFNKMNG